MMGENAEHRRMLQERPDGGFRFITVLQICSVWRGYRDGKISAMGLRVYFAAHEMAERRHAAKENGEGKGKPKFTVDELRELVGRVPEASLRQAAKQLECEGLLALRRDSVNFPAGTIAGDEMRQLHVSKRAGGSNIPVPRHLVKFIAAGLGRSDLATIFGQLIRGLWRKRDGEGEWLCHSGGACKASWVAEAFRVQERSVHRSRKRLAAVGLLFGMKTDHWHRQKHGGWFVVNLQWAKPVENAPGEEALENELSGLAAEESGQRAENRERLSAPCLNQELPTELRKPRIKNQEPATRRPAGVEKVLREGKTKPSIRDVKPEDLRFTSRLLELHRQACGRLEPARDERGRVVKNSAGEIRKEPLAEDTDRDRLEFVALAEHARAHGEEPVKLFMKNVLLRRFAFITGEDEKAALARLSAWREHREQQALTATRELTGLLGEPSAEKSRAEPETMSRARWLQMSEMDQLQWKIEQRRAQSG